MLTLLPWILLMSAGYMLWHAINHNALDSICTWLVPAYRVPCLQQFCVPVSGISSTATKSEYSLRRFLGVLPCFYPLSFFAFPFTTFPPALFFIFLYHFNYQPQISFFFFLTYQYKRVRNVTIRHRL